MTLIALIICIGLQWYLDIGGKKHSKGIFEAYVNTLNGWFGAMSWWTGIIGVCGIVLPVVLIVVVIQFLLADIWAGLLEFIFALAVVFYCLRGRNLKTELADYLSAMRGDKAEAALRYGSEYLGGEAPKDTSALVRSVSRKLLLDGETGFFGVIFWFVILGPVGAILYYSVTRLRESASEPGNAFAGLAKSAGFIQNILDWVPVRILGLSYALVGQFSSGFTHWMKHIVTGLDDTRELPYTSGMAAQNIDISHERGAVIDENENVISMMETAAIVWVVAIALFTLGSWLA